ncbi:MAG TPA: hypothetical protein DCY23_01625 [Ruminococcaceae bacterium]|nr:hypothetical protein [Oscillospiraceae bacterium]
MKKMKKLFPALCLLLVSATLLGTSTYAWFSMNKNVHANNMQITAKADTTYLLISADKNTAAGIQEDKKIEVSLGENKNLYPAALKTNTNPFTDADDNWWYASASTSDKSTKDDETVVTFGEAKSKKPTDAEAKEDATTFTERVLKKTVYLTLAKGSVNKGKLTVKATDFTDSIGSANATKLVVATATKALYFDGNNAATAQELVADGGMSDSEVITVNIYMYFDGENADVYTDNITALTSASANIHFAIAD